MINQVKKMMLLKANRMLLLIKNGWLSPLWRWCKEVAG